MSAQYLTFMIDQQTYGVQIASIREINRISDITKVPEAQPFVAGVMNLRGKVIPVVSLRLRMKLPDLETTRETCTIVVDTASGQVGVIVDAVKSVVSLEADKVDETPISQGDRTYIVGIGRTEMGMVMILDIDKCLDSVVATLSQETQSVSAETAA